MFVLMYTLDASGQIALIESFWNAVLSGLSSVLSIVHSSILLQLIFLIGLIETGVVIVRFFKKEDDSDK